jgi:hypothetical protein
VLEELRHDVIAAAEKIGKKKTSGGSSSRTS